MLTKKFCPKCSSENIDTVVSARGAPIGYICKDCKYQAPIFPEKELEDGS